MTYANLRDFSTEIALNVKIRYKDEDLRSVGIYAKRDAGHRLCNGRAESSGNKICHADGIAQAMCDDGGDRIVGNPPPRE